MFPGWVYPVGPGPFLRDRPRCERRNTQPHCRPAGVRFSGPIFDDEDAAQMGKRSLIITMKFQPRGSNNVLGREVPVTLDTRLREDLKIGWDDGDDAINTYLAIWHVDPSRRKFTLFTLGFSVQGARTAH